MRGWRGLAVFWICVCALIGGAAGLLASLGPPAQVASHGPWQAPRRQGSPGPSRLRVPSPIAAPERLLLEPASDFPGAQLPRIGPAGRTSALVYAGHADPADTRPKIALIVAGLGLDGADSAAAVADLPPQIDFAVSAYAQAPEKLLAAIRAAGHEYLLSLPMEPRGYPDDDEGARQLLTGATLPDTYRNMEWALSRLQGYAGVTGASDGQIGERFAASPVLMAGVEQELAGRGLFYIDPRPGAPPPARVPGRAVDAIVDDPPDAQGISSSLAQLEQAARRHGVALGLVGRPSPATVAHLAAWAASLAARGIVLTPVGAVLLHPPPP